MVRAPMPWQSGREYLRRAELRCRTDFSWFFLVDTDFTGRSIHAGNHPRFDIIGIPANGILRKFNPGRKTAALLEAVNRCSR